MNFLLRVFYDEVDRRTVPEPELVVPAIVIESSVCGPSVRRISSGEETSVCCTLFAAEEGRSYLRSI